MGSRSKDDLFNQRGVFPRAKKPLVTFSNAFFALSQRGATIQELFNGQQRRVETKWDSVEYDPEQWIYGGAVGGLASNILTGEDYNYLVECIVKKGIKLAESFDERPCVLTDAESLTREEGDKL